MSTRSTSQPNDKSANGDAVPDAPMQVCVLTASGRGAIATVAIRGPGTSQALAKHFRSASGRTGLPDRHVCFGHWFHGHSDSHNEHSDFRDEQSDVSDEQSESHNEHSAGESVVVCQGEGDSIEVHCHGGRAAIDSLVGDLMALGAIKVDAARWLIASGVGQLQCEYRLTLAKTQTLKTASIVLDQMRGALDHEVAAIVAQLESGDSSLQRIARDAIATLLMRYQMYGRYLSNAFCVTIAGPPNVGKSSLINRLLGYQRAITTDTPGTTRDVLRAVTAIDGWMYEFSDTAGIRCATDSIESQGVQRAENQIQQADLVLIVVDAAQGIQASHHAIAQSARRALWVMNKVDLLDEDQRRKIEQTSLAISTTEPTGIESLAGAIGDCLLPVKPEPGLAIPVSERCADLLQQALDASDPNDAIRSIECLRQISG